MLYGATGRTDLVGDRAHRRARRTRSSTPCAGWPPSCRRARRSSRPTASAASARPRRPAATESTVGEQARVNPALTQDEQAFVDQLIAGLGAYPAYYARMGPANAAGPEPVDLSRPRRVDPGGARAAALAAGEWVVDLRDPDRVRRRAPARRAQFRALHQLHHLPRVALRLGRPADPHRRDRRTGRRRPPASWSASASTGSPARPIGRPEAARPTAGRALLPRSATSPGSRRRCAARRPASRSSTPAATTSVPPAGSGARCTSRSTSWPTAGSRICPTARCGCTAARATAPRSPPPARPRRPPPAPGQRRLRRPRDRLPRAMGLHVDAPLIRGPRCARHRLDRVTPRPR